MTNRFLSKQDVMRMTGFSHVTAWRLEKRGRFPKRRQISPGRVGWLESEVLEWMESCPVSDIRPVVKTEEVA